MPKLANSRGKFAPYIGRVSEAAGREIVHAGVLYYYYINLSHQSTLNIRFYMKLLHF